MLPMVLAAALLATAADSPAALPAAPPPPPGAAPGARIFSYADLKAMDAKASGPAPSLKRPELGPGDARVATIHARRSERPISRHTSAISAQPPTAHPTAPKLRPAFAMKDGAKLTR